MFLGNITTLIYAVRYQFLLLITIFIFSDTFVVAEDIFKDEVTPRSG